MESWRESAITTPSTGVDQAAWRVGAGEDFKYPATTGKRPQKSWAEVQVGDYIADLMDLAPHDPAVFSAVTCVRLCL